METYIIVLGIAIFLATALVVILYLRSSLILLDLVKQDDATWRKLGCPEVVIVQGNGRTVSPLFPWMRWIWLGDIAGVSQPIATRRLTTRMFLRLGLAMIAGLTLLLPLMLLRT